MGLFPDGWDEIQTRLRATVMADRPPREIAGSFAFALFLVALPNMGLSLVLLGAIGYRVGPADPRAFTAAALILNPLVKGTVYVASFLIGAALLGPVPGGFSGLSLEMGRHVLTRLLIGNLLIAVILGIVGYLGLRYTIRHVHRFSG